MPPDAAGSAAGVVLAAGTSTRMGTNKMLLRLGGEPVVRRAVSRALEAGLEPVVVVLGHEADAVRAQLTGLACQPVVNADYARGINGSLRAGIAALPERVAAAVVMLADMPFVTSAMLGALVERYRQSRAPLVVSEYGGVLAPPMLYDRSLFPELGELEGDGCGKRVVKRHLDEALTVSWPPGALRDIDAPGDVEQVRRELDRD